MIAAVSRSTMREFEALEDDVEELACANGGGPSQLHDAVRESVMRSRLASGTVHGGGYSARSPPNSSLHPKRTRTAVCTVARAIIGSVRVHAGELGR